MKTRYTMPRRGLNLFFKTTEWTSVRSKKIMAKTTSAPKLSFADQVAEHAGAILTGITPPKVASVAAMKALEAMSPEQRRKFLASIPEVREIVGGLKNESKQKAQLLAGFSFVKNRLLPKNVDLKALREFQAKEELRTRENVDRKAEAYRRAQIEVLGAISFGELLDDPDDVLVQLFEAQEVEKRKAEAKALRKGKKAPIVEEIVVEEDDDDGDGDNADE